jgi:hypothetical protein
MESNSLMLIPHDYVVDEEGNVFPKGSGFGGKNTSLPSGYRKKLSAPIDKKMISKHPTKTFLSVIKAIAVAERLNDVFGINGWNLEHEVIEKTTIKVKEGEVGYIVMKGRIYIRKYDLYTPYQYGGHQLGGRGTEPADGYKSAVTDIQSKCGSLLEIGIQVFKGQPMSQEANESKKDAEEAEGIKQMTAKSQTPQEAAPKAAPKAAKKPAAKKPAKQKEEPTPPPAEEPEKVEAEEVPNTGENVDGFNTAVTKIESYLDSKELRENAEVIVFDAKMDGASDDQIAEIKQLVNQKYKQLIESE